MKVARVTLESITPYSQSGKHEAPRKEKESEDAYAQRTWKEFLHVNEAGKVFIPAMAFNKAIQTAAAYLRIQIPGKGNSEYQKHFKGGMTAEQDGLVLPFGPDDSKRVICERLYLNADGKSGGNKRVWRYYPTVPEWNGTLSFYIFDEIILQQCPGSESGITVFEKVLTEAGQFIGIGRFRAEKGGFYGRFKVAGVDWE